MSSRPPEQPSPEPTRSYQPAASATEAPAAEQSEAPTLPPPPLTPSALAEAETRLPPPAPGDSEAQTRVPVPSASAAGGSAGPGRFPPIPGYEIQAELGRGGMGVVYRAKHLRLNRTVALKMVLAGGHAGEAELVRFLAEGEAIARLRHPHIVQLYEAAQHDGLPYFTLEFVPGGSLAGKLDGTPLPAREAARLIEQVARGVQHAHANGIIHRDLKPANVLLDTDGTPKVTDFGLAKQTEAGTGITASNAVMGTPSYMAPEQAGGKTKEVGPLADVYGVGAMLYECLTGRPPFKAATVMDTMLQVIAAEPVPPRQLQPGLPADLETICLKCLQKDPRKRYADAAALAEDLRRFQAGEPIQARPVGRLERGWRWCRRNPVVASLTGALGLVVLAALALVTWQWREAVQQKDYAEQQKQNAEAQKQYADKQRQTAEAQKQIAEAQKQVR